MYKKPFRKPAEKKPAMKKRRRWCGKVCYPSAALAQNAIRQLTEAGKNHQNKEGVFESYFCKRCSGYHAGHNRFKTVA